MTPEDRQLWMRALYSVFTGCEIDSVEEKFFYDWWWDLKTMGNG